MSLVLAGASGALFGAGLLVSGMTLPDKVRGFLDATAWDPSLAFVMGGALLAYAVLARLIAKRRSDPWFDIRFHLPTRRDIDLPLVGGAALFGVGWGLAGACPGPGLVAAATGNASALAFVGAMLVGMWIFGRTSRT
ncbi:MAG: DUF6691 family protein [Kofleriaceae bacterium]